MLPELFPLDFADKVNSPELEAFFRAFPHIKYLDAVEINWIRDCINALNGRSAGSRPQKVVVSHEVVGGVYLFEAGDDLCHIIVTGNAPLTLKYPSEVFVEASEIEVSNLNSEKTMFDF